MAINIYIMLMFVLFLFDMIGSGNGNGNTELKELNDSANYNDNYRSQSNTQRPLQQFYQNKSDEDSTTVKQVTLITVCLIHICIFYHTFCRSLKC